MNTSVKWLPVAGLIGAAVYDVSVGNYAGAIAQIAAAAGLLGLHIAKQDAETK